MPASHYHYCSRLPNPPGGPPRGGYWQLFSVAEGTAAKLRGGGAKALNQPYKGRRGYSVDTSNISGGLGSRSTPPTLASLLFGVLCLYVYLPSARLHQLLSLPPSLRLRRNSRPPFLHTSRSTCLQRASSAPCPSVRPRRLQRASTPLVLHASTSPRLRHASRVSEFYGSMTPRLDASNASPELHTCLHVPTPTASL